MFYRKSAAEYLLAAVNLARLSYDELHEQLNRLPSRDLLPLLEAHSVKIGDTAADILSRRNARKLLLKAALSESLRTRNGKVRVLNTLSQRGRSMPEAIPAYLKYLNDSHRDVVDCALFALVHWNSRKFLPSIRAIRDPRVRDLRDKAIKAIERRSPKIYSEHFWDMAGVWKRRN